MKDRAFQALAHALEHVQAASKAILETQKPPPGPYAIFHHHSHLVERVRDFSAIYADLIATHKTLNKVQEREFRVRDPDWPAGVAYPPKMQRILKRDHLLTHRMKIGVESLYMFGAILLDQLSYLIAYCAAVPKPEEFDFARLVQQLGKSANNLLMAIDASAGADLVWLHFQFRTYRNKFIVHSNRPWQRGNIGGHHDFRLFTPSPPGWLDDAQLKKDIKKYVLPNIPASKDWADKRPIDILDRAVDLIGTIKDQSVRDKIAELVAKAGFTTPTYQSLGRVLAAVLERVGEAISRHVSANAGLAVLGAPSHAKTQKAELGGGSGLP